MALAAHEIAPAHDARLQLETPVRSPSFRFQRRRDPPGQAKRGAVIDRRAAQRLLALAAPVEFLGGFVAGIEPAYVDADARAAAS